VWFVVELRIPGTGARLLDTRARMRYTFIMNQDQVKTALLQVEDAPLDFSVIFSGKKSVKVNGLYKSESREIIIHNKNFDDDNLLLYTALHEYAHHLDACAKGGKLSKRPHSAEFRAILVGLLEKAEKAGVYNNAFEASPELMEITARIKEHFLMENGKLLKEFGQKLLEASDICKKMNVRFDDYIDRVLNIPRRGANAAIKMYKYDVAPGLGPDNMRYVASIPNEERRKTAENALLSGKNPDSVKTEMRGQKPDGDPKVMLEKEKARLSRTIETLKKRLAEVEAELERD
jgi:hypothetical protein